MIPQRYLLPTRLLAVFFLLVSLNSTSLADEMRRVSIGVTGSVKASGSMLRPSDDGRFVSFISRESNIVPNDFNYEMDVFVFDRQTGTTERVSIATDGTESNGYSSSPSLSADGRFVAFASRASNLLTGGANGTPAPPNSGIDKIFVHDRLTGTTRLVSQSSTGVPANNSSVEPRISANGQAVIFSSAADNLVANDTNGSYDLFYHILSNSQTIRIGTGASVGDQLPDISGDGRYVTYSTRDSLVAEDTNGAIDVYLYDVQAGLVELISKNQGGTAASGRSPSMSADGRYVSFNSSAANIVAEAYAANSQVFIYDRQTDTISLVSRSDTNAPIGQIDRHQLSNNGRVLVFNSNSDDYVAADTNGFEDVFRRDLISGATEIVSKSFDGSQSDGYSVSPDVDASGNLVVFDSTSNNIVDGAYSYSPADWYTPAAYAYDATSQSTEVISRPLNLLEPPTGAWATGLTSDGGTVFFTSETDNYLPEFENGLNDIYKYNVAAGTYERIAQPAVSGFLDRYYDAIPSPDGTKVIYERGSENTGLGEYQSDIYVYEEQTQTHTLVSGTSLGFPSDGRCGLGHAMSPDASVIAFACNSTNIVSGDTNSQYDVFVRDTSANSTTRISVHSDGTEGNGRSYYPFLSDDGNFVLFRSDATNLVDNDTNGVRDVFLHDRTSGETRRISEVNGVQGNGISATSRISHSGRYIAFASLADNLADGPKSQSYDVILFDSATGSYRQVSRGWDGQATDHNSFPSLFSRDEKYLIFTSAASNLVPNDTNRADDTFFYNIASGAVCRYNARLDDQEVNSHTYVRHYSDDGAVALVNSMATNLYSSDTNGSFDVYLKTSAPFSCDYKAFVDSLPDINGNGIPDVAALLPGATNQVEVRDGSTDALISSIDFGADSVVRMAVLPDLDSSGRPEIAVLQQQASGQVRVQLRDSLSGNVVRNLFYGSQYTATAMQVLDDYNGHRRYSRAGARCRQRRHPRQRVPRQPGPRQGLRRRQ
jgi:hypothetical protein